MTATLPIVARQLFAGAALLFAVTACGGGPRALVLGEDSCAHCRMTITDPRFGGLVETARGKVLTFDAVECLAAFVQALPVDAPPRGVWVADYANGGRWIAVEEARFVHGGSLRSPMGRSLAAFAPGQDAARLRREFGGEVIAWADVLALVASEATPAGATTTHDHDAHAAADTMTVSPAGPVRTITEALERVSRAGVVRITAGVYREPTILVRRPVTLVGDPGAVIDGEGQRELLVVGADSVTVRGLTFRNTGVSHVQDRAALRVVESAGCLIEANRFEQTLFGVYLQRASACLVRGNVLDGIAGSQTATGNGLHLWSSRDVVLEDNVVRGHRDGIYFEFVTNGVVQRNRSEGSHRYGLHFMFSDSCRYEDNTFRENTSGVAVMYSRHVHIAGNRFVRNRGSAAYGLLLKEISDSEVLRNAFTENSIALHLEGASRNRVADNDFVRNGWALRVLADAQDNRITGNAFAGNAFDVGTNSRRNYSTFAGNWWDRYRGYDLDRDGVGDVAHAPVRLFSLLVEQSPPALVLVRSFLVDLLDLAERAMPALTPETLRDAAPLMRAPRRLP
jgi:nitrous oxidase accessory protein